MSIKGRALEADIRKTIADMDVSIFKEVPVNPVNKDPADVKYCFSKRFAEQALKVEKTLQRRTDNQKV